MEAVIRKKKQGRCKQFSEWAIQGTNNSSIVSKRSVEVTYWPKLLVNKNLDDEVTLEYFKHFVPKPLQRSPCINRGYWLRLHAIRSRLDEISAKIRGAILIINLGCGFDPLSFQLLDRRNLDSKNYLDRFTFLDIDYPELINEKLSIIASNEELKEILGEPVGPGKYEKYSLMSCDLNYPVSFMQLLNSLDDSSTKIFIAEVSLAYMKSEKADDIIRLCSRVRHSQFILLEQLTPESSDDPFAHQMLFHFSKNRSPLQSVVKYTNIESQRCRFNSLGFPYVNAGDMFQIWCSLDESIRFALQQVEPFDELEEFHLFSHHYLILHASNEPFLFETFLPVKLPCPAESVELPAEYFEFGKLRKFGASVFSPCNNRILYFGGLCPQRSNELLSIEFNGKCEIIPCGNVCPCARACHTFTLTDKNMAVIVGGRKNPRQPLADTWKFYLSSRRWVRGPNLPEGRYRHVACYLGENNILILGGKTLREDLSAPSILLNIHQDSVKTLSSELPSLISAAADYNIRTGIGVLVGGGYADESNISNIIYVFSYRNESLVILDTWQDLLFCRYGAQATFVDENHVVLAGGSGPFLFNCKNAIMMLDIRSHTFKCISMRSPLPMLVGNELHFVSQSQELILLAGGATCYGFGSVWNDGTRIKMIGDCTR